MTTTSIRHKRIAQRVQQNNRKQWLSDNGLLLIAGLVVVLIWGWVGSNDYQALMLQQASDTCHNQSEHTIPTYAQCIDNQLNQQ